MTGHWAALLGELTALAAVVALSPFSVIPAIALVVHSERARAVGLAFVAGWLTGKAAITVGFLGVPRLLAGAFDRPAPAWAPWLQVAAGALLLLGSLWYWRRHLPASRRKGPLSGADSGAFASARGEKELGTPRWLARIKHITPAGAAAVGVALTLVNPKVLLACATAGIAIGHAAPGLGGTVAAVAYFTLLAGSSAALPILAYAVWSHRVDRHLDRFKSWLARHQAGLTAGLLALVGLALLVSGVREVW